MSSSQRLAAGLAAVVAVALFVDCRSESKPRRKSISRKGVATHIDLTANSVAMRTRLEKSGKEVEFTGAISPDTEVWINGVKKSLADVEANDQVEVECERIGEGAEQKFIVKRVEVTRPMGWKSTQAGKPAAAGQAEQATTAPVSLLSARTTQPTAAAGGDIERRREAAMNQIYAEIRRRMSEALKTRSEFLKSGVPQADPKVQEQEKIIRNARNLLMENGENLEPVMPPLLDEHEAAPAAHATSAKAGK